MTADETIEDKAEGKLRDYYQQMVSLQVEVSKTQARMLAIIDLFGWSPEQANDIIGVNFFAGPDGEDKH